MFVRTSSTISSGDFRVSEVLDRQHAQARIGAQATPTMFVNGEKVEGAVPFEMLKAVIDRKLAAR